MKLYDIAGLKVGLKCESITEKRAKKYLSEFDGQPDIYIETDYTDVVEKARKLNLIYDAALYGREGTQFYRELLDFNGIMLHSSAVVVDGNAYLFSASCGTGKSTHTGKWLELFGEDAYILNDDKPAIRVLEDGIYAYGTPWSGKHDLSVNAKVPLQGICFLKRDMENWIRPMDKMVAATRLYHGTVRILTAEQVRKSLDVISAIANDIPIWEMGCTPTIEAAQMAYDAMSKGEIKR